MNYIQLIFILLMISPSINAQDLYKPGQRKSDFLSHAQVAYDKGDFYTAFSYYKEANEFDGNDIQTTYKTAEAARQFQAFGEAETFYSKVLNHEDNGQFSICSYWLADVQQKQGKYKKAALNYRLYLAEHSGDNLYLEKRSKMQMAACEWAQNQLDDPSAHISLVHLGKEINTPYSEFGGILSGEDMYYTSLRYKMNDKNSSTDKLRSKILLKQNEATPLPIDEISTNDQVWTAHTAFGKKGSVMYYTLCDYIDEMDIRCEIYYRKMENNQWGESIRLPEQINIDSFTATDPTIGFNERINKEVLYFVSDRNGGKGKKDIWYSVIDENMNFSVPMNLTGINTIEDDISPFYDLNKNILYFSSEGYLGMGGFDVYKTYIGGNGWDGVTHMGTPLNSSYNDIYYSLNEDGTKGLLATNREGSYYLEDKPKACCYDLYSVDIQPCDILLDVFTFDKFTKDSLREVTVTIHDIKRGDDQIITIFEKNISKFKFPIECSRSYEILAEREGYLPAKTNLTTPKPGEVIAISRSLYLEPRTVNLQVLVFNKETGLPINGAKVELVELPNNTLIDYKINNQSNNFNFKPAVCKNYQLVGLKRGFLRDEKTVEFPCNYLGDRVVKLYLTPYLTGILPIVLYFDNDHPNPRTYTRSTKLTYSSTFDPYYAKKEEFKTNYVLDNSTEDGNRIDNFFEADVRGGYDQLQEFLSILLIELSKGKSFEIFLKGFASPRAKSGYNKALGGRRIQSVKNEFRKYSKNKIKKYLKNGQLKISERSFGEDQAPSGISDDFKDRRNSIYSVEASSQRKVEIVEVKSKN